MKARITAPAFAALLLIDVTGAAVAANGPAQGITLAQQSSDQWRAYKLVGVTIYGPDNKAVGKITDILMNHDGVAQDVVVGVGGFLGIGEKDVAIPFAAVNFSDKPMPAAAPATTPPGSTATNGGTAALGSGMASPTPGVGTPADTLGTVSNPAMGNMAGDASMLPSTAFPYYGTIAFTADQLKSAPSFKFAR